MDLASLDLGMDLPGNPADRRVVVAMSGGVDYFSHRSSNGAHDLFDGEDEEAVKAARARWAEAKSGGFDVTYWQPDERGRWQRKA